MLCSSCGTPNDDNNYKCVSCKQILHPDHVIQSSPAKEVAVTTSTTSSIKMATRDAGYWRRAAIFISVLFAIGVASLVYHFQLSEDAILANVSGEQAQDYLEAMDALDIVHRIDQETNLDKRRALVEDSTQKLKEFEPKLATYPVFKKLHDWQAPPLTGSTALTIVQEMKAMANKEHIPLRDAYNVTCFLFTSVTRPAIKDLRDRMNQAEIARHNVRTKELPHALVDTTWIRLDGDDTYMWGFFGKDNSFGLFKVTKSGNGQSKELMDAYKLIRVWTIEQDREWVIEAFGGETQEYQQNKRRKMVAAGKSDTDLLVYDVLAEPQKDHEYHLCLQPPGKLIFRNSLHDVVYVSPAATVELNSEKPRTVEDKLIGYWEYQCVVNGTPMPACMKITADREVILGGLTSPDLVGRYELLSSSTNGLFIRFVFDGADKSYTGKPVTLTLVGDNKLECVNADSDSTGRTTYSRSSKTEWERSRDDFRRKLGFK